MLKAIFKAVPFWGHGERESLKLQGFPTLLGLRSWWPGANELNPGKVKDESRDSWLPGLKQWRRNHSCLKNKVIKLSNSCTLRNQKGRGVLLRLWLISPAAPGRSNVLYVFPLVAELQDWVSSHLTTADQFPPPALLPVCCRPPGARPGPLVDGPSKGNPDADLSQKGPSRKEEGGERARFFWTLFSLCWKVLWNKQCGCCMVNSKPSGHLLKKQQQKSQV